MSRIVAVKLFTGGVSDQFYVTKDVLKKLCSMVEKDNFIVLGRYGTNKAALRKLLVKK
jgi:hypothetical protein